MTSSSETGALLLEEWPYAYVMDEEKAASYCHYCLKSKCINQTNLLQCSRCQFAHYCDEKCQTFARKDHEEECKCMEPCDGYVPSRKARLIARIIFKRNDKFEPDLNLPDDLKKRRFKDLMNHDLSIIKDKKRFDQFRHICDELNRYLISEHRVSAGILLDIFGKVTINTFAIYNHDVQIGLGLYVGASILDHACDPNVFASFDGPRIVIRSLKADLGHTSLKDLRISYFGTFVPTKERQFLSSSRFYFECDCSLCKDKLRVRAFNSHRGPMIKSRAEEDTDIYDSRTAAPIPPENQTTVEGRWGGSWSGVGVTWDLEMRSMKCQHCSGVAFLDENNVTDFAATCQSCALVTDGTKAVELTERLKCALERFDSNPAAFEKWRDMKSIPDQLMSLDQQTSSLLSDINIYSCRLSINLQRICTVAGLTDEALKHCLKALKALQHFLHPHQPLRLSQTKSAGIALTENVDTIEQGIQLLTEATYYSKRRSLSGDEHLSPVPASEFDFQQDSVSDSY